MKKTNIRILTFPISKAGNVDIWIFTFGGDTW